MDEFVKIRNYLHAHPELSGQETGTNRYIADYLLKRGIRKIHQNVSLQSLVAEIEGEKPGPTLLFRCELDALPIEEYSQESHRSRVKEVSHACGHDGHMAIMLGVAEEFVANMPPTGTILLLFQSAEETGQGARGILDSHFLRKFDIDYVFALHNMPGYNFTDIICKPGNFTPVVESLNIKLSGRTSHAAEPGMGVNPAKSIAAIIQYLNNLVNLDKSSESYFLATPIQIRMGEEAYGTSAGEAVLRYTFRAWDNAYFETKKKEIEKGVNKITSKVNGLETGLSWIEPFKANKNHPEACRVIEKAARVNNYKYIEKDEPLTWGEDFGFFTEIFNGAMFGIGAGPEHPSLHNPDYDFPDDLIQPGINMYISIANEILNK